MRLCPKLKHPIPIEISNPNCNLHKLLICRAQNVRIVWLPRVLLFKIGTILHIPKEENPNEAYEQPPNRSTYILNRMENLPLGSLCYHTKFQVNTPSSLEVIRQKPKWGAPPLLSYLTQPPL